MASKEKYYMPYGAREFLGWGKNFMEAARANKAEFGFTDAELDGLDAELDGLEAAVDRAGGETASNEDKRHKKTALAAARRRFRVFVNTRVNYNDRIDNEGRAALRTHIQDETRTTIPVPADLVRLRIRPLEGHGHRIDYVSEATGKKARPYGMIGVVLARKILEEGEAVPVRGKDLPDTKLLTGSPRSETYPPDLAGRRVAYSAAWQNTKGERGKFSDVEVHVIP